MVAPLHIRRKKKDRYLYYADVRRIFFYLHRAFHPILRTQALSVGKKSQVNTYTHSISRQRKQDEREREGGGRRRSEA